MKLRRHTNQILRGAIACLLLPIGAHSSGFQLLEQSANSLAYSHADMAALADDASTAYFNPAGMTRLCRPQVLIGGTFSTIRTSFDGYLQLQTPPGNANSTGFANSFTTSAYSQNFGFFFGEAVIWTLSEDPDSPIINANFKVPRSRGETHPVAPYFHYVQPIYRSCNWDIAAGISAVVPFGGETDFSGTYVQSYSTNNKFEQVCINPSLAIRYKKLSVGAGVDYSILKDFYSIRSLNCGSEVYLSNSDPTLRRIDLSSRGSLWSWNIGALFEFTPSFRVGMTYRPRTVFRQKGDINIIYPAAVATCDFPVPDTLNGGFYFDLNCKWALLGTVAYTWWNRVEEIVVKTNVPIFPISFGGVNIDAEEVIVPLQCNNTVLVALGSKYTVSNDLNVKFGISYDKTPTSRIGRELKLPDADRYGISTGLHYDINCHLALDIAYQFLYMFQNGIKNNPLITATINSPESSPPFSLPNGGAVFNGSSKTAAQLFSMQLSWTF